jgi:copper(I)-binding protein
MAALRPLLCLMVLAAAAGPAAAQEFKAGDIAIEQPWSRATPKGAAVGVGYLIVHNRGAAPDTLIGGSADFADAVQVHEMTMTGGVMRMRALTGGLVIPANGEVALSPNGTHLMFMKLKRPLTKGETVKASLAFEHAGAIAVEFKVGGLGDTSPGGAAKPAAPGAMKGMKMNGM